MSNTYTDDGSQAAGGRSDPEPQTTPTLKDQVGAARDKIGELNRTVRDEAHTFTSSARREAASRVEQRKQKVTGTIHDFADAVHRAGDELNQRDQTMAARLVSRAAEGLEDVSRTLADKRPSEMVEGLRDFGRRNPTAFLAGSVLLGVALGRFLRSSRPEPEVDEGEVYAAGIGGYEGETLVRGDMGRSDAETGGVISASGVDDSVGMSAGSPSDGSED